MAGKESDKDRRKSDPGYGRMTDSNAEKNTDENAGATEREERATENPLHPDEDETITGEPRPDAVAPDAAGAAQGATQDATGNDAPKGDAPGADAAGDPAGAGGIAEEDEPIDPLQVLRDELETVRAELATAREEAAALKDQLLRALAEGENQRRRHMREKEETKKFGSAMLAKDMLTVSDNLERALANIPADALEADPHLKSLHEGVSATERELKAALERHQIRKIEPLGEKFDSNFHQAMFEVESAGHAPGTVAQVLQPGYVMHGDRLLRPALVAVAKAPAKKADGEDGDGGETKAAND